MLRNRKEVTEPKLRGVNRAADPMKIKLGTFVELANFIQGKRWKLKKKRGVVELNTDAVTLTAEPCTGSIPCTDNTLRAQQALINQSYFVQSDTFLDECGFGGVRTSWAYISPAEEVYTLLGCAGCAGGNMDYDICTQINHFEGPLTLSHPDLIDPVAGHPSFMKIGEADEPMYMPEAAIAYYVNSDTSVTYPFPPAGLIYTSEEAIFAKKGTSIYLLCHDTVFPNFFPHIVEYNASSGAQLNNFEIAEHYGVNQISLTASYLYILGEVTGSNEPSIRKYARSDFTLVDEFFIDDLQPICIGIVSDDLIYVLSGGEKATLRYITEFTDLVYVGYAAALSISPFGGATGRFQNGAFYYGGSGHFGFSTDIQKIELECPEDLNAAITEPSITLSADTVAAGDDITVSWTDILVTDPFDTVMLFNAPAAGRIGFVIDGQLAGQFVSGASPDSEVFTIPLATPPGDYVIFYSGPGQHLPIARSAVFTVT